MNKFHEYALFIEDTARLQDRRQMVTNIYVAVNTVLLSAVALLVTGEEAKSWAVVVGALAVLCGGVAICLFWRQLIRTYKALISLRFRELRRMEELPEMAGCQQMYHVEDELYPRDESGKVIRGQGLSISDLERRLPETFILLYVICGVGIVAAQIVGLL